MQTKRGQDGTDAGQPRFTDQLSLHCGRIAAAIGLWYDAPCRVVVQG